MIESFTIDMHSRDMVQGVIDSKADKVVCTDSMFVCVCVRALCRNMITIDAHSRDMVQGVIESKADKVDCFQWVCQLRSYWDSTINDCRIKICDASFPYGYEYLGNGARLVSAVGVGVGV